uniref:Uncharacterized protein n=1 Tax=Amphora coffeiformis TaxID=265554 RepID=A0A7S3P903_9STRA|mmetsp:Transcript_5474/g.10628  ORF Transcript_5474/g.10628 Transcript_5474/m.10628 type:complete len:261 (+) Transcript_5474:100-882(+)|eukprot:scaffold5296_cov163-Amphora_coffeaeformis.AAC.4
MLSATLPPNTEVPHKFLSTEGPEDDSFGFIDTETVEATSTDSDSGSEQRSVLLQAHPEVLQSSIRHIDSLANFVKHCEQQKDADDEVPTLEEEQQHKVHFRHDDDLVVFHLIPSVQEKDRSKVWQDTKDFEESEKEIKKACMRWEMRDKLAFDEDLHSIRGLEHLYKEQDGKPSSKRRHRKAVQAEIKRQKEEHGKLDDLEKLREVSEAASHEDLEKFLALGKADYEASIKAWEAKPVDKATLKKDEKKKGRGLRFWKKK